MYTQLGKNIQHSVVLRRFINHPCCVDAFNVNKHANPIRQLCSSANESLHDRLADAVTPLWKVPYPKQLEIKDEQNFEIMLRLTKKLKPNSNSNNIICQLKETLPSPVISHYRNKNEFHIKYDSNGRVIVGMCIGKAFNNTLQCVSAEKLLNTHPSHANIAKHFQDYIQNHSKWKVCEHFQHGGNWRQLTIRSNHRNELMAITTVHPQDLTRIEIQEEMNQMKDYIASCSIKNLISLYYQSCPHTRCTAEQSPFILLDGQSHIYESIGNYEFRISPESFFQVNTQGARVLYDTVAHELHPERLSTVVDLCCGTGTQGLMVAHHCRGVVGIELSRSAVEDARFNAVHNQIHNAEFFTGRVEQIFQPILNQLETSPDIAVIINPSRGGVSNRVIQMLRDNERVRHLVYISCQADGPAMNNFFALCEEPHRKLKSEPFQLRKAIPVDMFPHTNHCELVLSFRR